MNRRPIFYAAIITLFAGPVLAYLASNDLVVEQIDQTRFEVPYRGESGAPAFWCAAGDYVIRHLDMSPTTPIWRISEPSRRRGEGISFSLTSDGAASRTGIARFSFGGSRSAALSAAHAQQLCERSRLRR